MGKHSSLGPIDPQISGIPAHGVIEEFEKAVEEIHKDRSNIPIWQPLLAKYPPAFIGECEKAIDWANEIVKEWLITGMFVKYQDAKKRANKVLKELADHALTKSHARHISLERASQIGLEVKALETDHVFQDAVLTVHHATIQTLSATAACKIIENHRGIAHIHQMQIGQLKQ